MSEPLYPPLEETIQLQPYETAASAASRAAALYDADHARDFCWAYFLDFEKIAAGDEQQIRELARLLSVDHGELSKWSPVRAGNGSYHVNGEPLTSFRSRRTRLRGCIECFKAQIAASPGMPVSAVLASTAPTLVDPVRTCFIHNASYVQLTDKSMTGDHQHDHALLFTTALEEWEELEEATIRRKISEFELYLLGRLQVTPRVQVPLLDTLTITDVTKICNAMGVFELHGREAVISDFDEHAQQAAAQAGFALLAAGAEGIRDFVTRAHAAADGAEAEGLSNRTFGRFHYFLNSIQPGDEQFFGIKQIIIDRLSEIVPYGPEDAPIFGVRPQKRYWHTLMSAERQYGIPARTILKRLKREGIGKRLNSKHVKARYVVAADALEQLLVSEEHCISQLEVVQRTGVDTHEMKAIRAAGLLVPKVVGKSGHHALFRRGDVFELEGKLRRLAVEQQGEVPGMVTLYRAYRDTNWNRPEILKFMADGAAPISAVAGLRSFEGLRIDIEALRKLHPFHGREIMNTEQAAILLKVAEGAIQRLIMTDSIAWDYVRINKTGKLKKAVFRDTMEEFRRRYIPLSEVVKTFGVPHVQVRAWVRDMGIPEEFNGVDLGCTFYARDMVMQLGPDTPRPVRKPPPPRKSKKVSVGLMPNPDPPLRIPSDAR